MILAPTRSPLAPVLLLAAALAAAAQAATTVTIVNPAGDRPVFGAIDLEVAVESTDPVSEVVMFVDGSLVARWSKPPYRLRWDAGQHNAEHQFVAEATTLFGKRIRATRTTPAIEVGEEVEVALIQVYARVTTRTGKRPPVRPSKPSDFLVLDDKGRPLSVTTVSDGEVPISAAVLLDASESMKGEPFRRAVAGAKSAAGLLKGEDEVMIALFSDRLLRASEFTADRASLNSALQDVEAAGGSAVFDHLYFGLNRLGTRLGRPVVILLSDGEDVTSTLDADDIRWRTRRSQATLYWVRIEPEGGVARRYATFWRDQDVCEAGIETLEASVKESGGAIVSIKSVEELSTALIQIFDDLRSQIVVGFHPEDRRHDGSWRPIRVGMADPGLSVSARAGYVDE